MSAGGFESIDRVPTGIEGLDTILRGGFLKGGLYIVQGTPGAGKTTLANQICFYHAARGERTLYITLLAEYHARMMQHMGAMSFFDASLVPDKVNYLSAFGTLRKDGLSGLLDILRREIISRQATILILDGFATAQRSTWDTQGFDEFAHELQGVAIATDCTIFLLSSSSGVKHTPEYTIVDGIVELGDELSGWSVASVLQVIKLRGSDYLRGKHAFRITDNGLVVYPRTEALLASPSLPDKGGIEKTSSGGDQLDVILGGGLPIASTTMILGPSGVGKTTLGLHFLSRCSPSEPGLLFGFYETPARILAKTDGVCQRLRGLIEDGTVEVLWQPPTDGLIDAYGQRLLEAVRRRGVRRLFIDGLGAFRKTASDPSRIGHFLTALMNELRVTGVTTVYTMEVAALIGPPVKAPIDELSSVAENLVMLRFVELRSRLYRVISVLKVRDSDFDPTLHLYTMTSAGLSIELDSDGAEAIMADFAHWPVDGAAPDAGDKLPRLDG